MPRGRWRLHAGLQQPLRRCQVLPIGMPTLPFTPEPLGNSLPFTPEVLGNSLPFKLGTWRSTPLNNNNNHNDNSNNDNSNNDDNN